jgi:hypothetical protein
MSYWARFGNTEVRVERLPYSDGVCDHCGKKGIKYLAHVRQQLADTLNRVYGGTLARDDDQVAELGARLIDGNTVKKVSVGCVCVSKYLLDCGVDTGLAQRLQKGVNTITNLLKNITKVEGFNTPTGIQTVIEEWGSVSVARQERNEASDAYRNTPYRYEFRLPDTCSPEEKDRGLAWMKMVKDRYVVAVDEYCDIKRKFRAKYFGLTTSYMLDEARVSKHFEYVTRRFQRTLDIYTKIGEYE